MRRERRELSLELGDARGQSVALGLERLAVARAHHHNLRSVAGSRTRTLSGAGSTAFAGGAGEPDAAHYAARANP